MPHFHLSSTEIAWEWKVNILPRHHPTVPILEDQSLKSWKTILSVPVFSILCAKIIFTRELWRVRRAYPSMHQCANAAVIAGTSVLLLTSLVNAVQRENKEICRFRKNELNKQQKVCIWRACLAFSYVNKEQTHQGQLLPFRAFNSALKKLHSSDRLNRNYFLSSIQAIETVIKTTKNVIKLSCHQFSCKIYNLITV